MIHIYHGDGKGKTTAAFGLAMRMLGYQKKGYITQFLKDGDSGEMLFLKNCEHVVLRYSKLPQMFYFQLDQKQQQEVANQQHHLFLTMCKESSSFDFILLDEILDALSLHMISEEELIAFLEEHREQEIVLTGRNPSKRLQELADYVVEMKNIKHPYQKQIPSRKGVEY